LLFDVDTDSSVVGLATYDGNCDVARVGDRAHHAVRPDRLAAPSAANAEGLESQFSQGVACRGPTQRETRPPSLRSIRPQVSLLERVERWNAL
jgi:hypothetical protein